MATAVSAVDNVYVNVNPPQPVIPSGGSSYSGAAPGLACWGPLNSPQTSNTPQTLMATWGPPIGSGFDLVQDGALFLKQFPNGGFTGVRVDDGTSVKASGVLMDAGVTGSSPVAPAAGADATGLYTGTLGNTISISLTTGSNYATGAKTWKITIQCASYRPEIFDRIVGQTPAAAWANIIAAVNNGQSATIPASQFIRLAQPTTPSTVLPPITGQTVNLTGGTNGGMPTTAQVLGVDGSAGSRTGLYALRGCGADLFWLCGTASTDYTGWSTLLAMAKSETAMAIASTPAGETVASAIALRQEGAIDDPYFILLTSWITYVDTYLNQNVSLPPTPVVAGVICSVLPHESPGNRVVYGIIGTEQTLGPNPQNYGATDMGLLESNGINFIAYPIPAANAFGVRHGKCSSSNFATSEIPYGRKTNDLVTAFSGPVMGQFVNRLQTTLPNDPLREAVCAALNDYLGPQQAALYIDNFNVICDLTNNSLASIRAGILIADVIVEYLAVVDQFQINLTAGQTVDVVAASSAPSAGSTLQ